MSRRKFFMSRDLNAAARLYCKAEAQRLHARISTHNPFAPMQAFMHQGIATGILPHEPLYMPGSYSFADIPDLSDILYRAVPTILHNENIQDRYAWLGLCMKKLDPKNSAFVRYGEGSIRLLSGWELHQKVVESENYYLRYVKERNAIIHAESTAEDVDGANVLALCVGNGKFAAKKMKALVDAGATPNMLIIHDLVTAEMLDEAAEEICLAAPRLRGRVKVLPGLNVFSPRFSRQVVESEMRRAASNSKGSIKEVTGKRNVVMIDGFANDLTKDGRQALHGKIKRVCPDYVVYEEDDNTQDKDLLRKGYDYPEVYQWLVRGYVTGYWAIGVDVDPDHITCRMDIKEQKMATIIRPNIVYEGDEKFKVRGRPYILPHIVPIQIIRKGLEENTVKELKQEGMLDIRPLPYRDDGTYPEVRFNSVRYITPKAA